MRKKSAEKPAEPQRTYRLDGYAPFIIGAIYILLFLFSVVMELYFFIDLHPGPEGWRELAEAENLRKIGSNIASLLCFELPFVLVTAIIFCLPYYKMTIQDDCFVLYAYFCKPFKLYYSDVRYCGIDCYNTTKYGTVWYIYFHRDLIPRAKKHKQKAWLFERRNINLGYTEKLYDSLVFYLPEDMSTMLKSCHSWVHLEYSRKWGEKYAKNKK